MATALKNGPALMRVTARTELLGAVALFIDKRRDLVTSLRQLAAQDGLMQEPAHQLAEYLHRGCSLGTGLERLGLLSMQDARLLDKLPHDQLSQRLRGLAWSQRPGFINLDRMRHHYPALIALSAALPCLALHAVATPFVDFTFFGTDPITTLFGGWYYGRGKANALATELPGPWLPYGSLISTLLLFFILVFGQALRHALWLDQISRWLWGDTERHEAGLNLIRIAASTHDDKTSGSIEKEGFWARALRWLGLARQERGQAGWHRYLPLWLPNKQRRQECERSIAEHGDRLGDSLVAMKLIPTKAGKPSWREAEQEQYQALRRADANNRVWIFSMCLFAAIFGLFGSNFVFYINNWLVYGKHKANYLNFPSSYLDWYAIPITYGSCLAFAIYIMAITTLLLWLHLNVRLLLKTSCKSISHTAMTRRCLPAWIACLHQRDSLQDCLRRQTLTATRSEAKALSAVVDGLDAGKTFIECLRRRRLLSRTQTKVLQAAEHAGPKALAKALEMLLLDDPLLSEERSRFKRAGWTAGVIIVLSPIGLVAMGKFQKMADKLGIEAESWSPLNLAMILSEGVSNLTWMLAPLIIVGAYVLDALWSRRPWHPTQHYRSRLVRGQLLLHGAAMGWPESRLQQLCGLKQSSSFTAMAKACGLAASNRKELALALDRAITRNRRHRRILYQLGTILLPALACLPAVMMYWALMQAQTFVLQAVGPG